MPPASDNFEEYIRRRKDGLYMIEIKDANHFTPEQRRYLHRILHLIGEYRGNTIEDNKDDFQEALGLGRYVTIKRRGEFIIQKFQRKSTEELTMSEYSKLIDMAVNYCRSNNIYIEEV